MKAFVFTSHADLPLAAMCVSRLHALGWEAVTVGEHGDGTDIEAAFPRGSRLRGSACAAGMARTMAEHASGASVVAKVDADTRLSASGSQWLAGAVEKARCLSFHHHSWSGIWAAPERVMPMVARLLESARCSTCPESRLFQLCFMKTCLAEDGPEELGRVWVPGRPTDGSMLTLPSNRRESRRIEAGTAMFGLAIP